MYQAIHYSYKNRKYYLRDDKEGWLDFEYQPQLYKRVPNQEKGALEVLTGGYCIPVKGKVEYNDPDVLEKDIDKELVVLRDLYYKNDESVPSWHNIVYLDIEIEMGGALTVPYIRESSKPITSISLIDVTTKQKMCFIVDNEKVVQEINQDGKHIIPCLNEKDLVYKFLNKWEELDPTIVVTWNGAYFDMPYLYYRINKILGKEYVNRLSPIKEVTVYDKNPEINSVSIGGINHLDYMLLHKKYIMKEEPSYKLKDIGPKYTELEKIEFEGNLNQLFKRDINTYIDYNLRDVEILEKLEDKLKFIQLTILISHICNIPYEQIYYSTTLGEGAILKHLKRLNVVSPNKPVTHNPNRRGKEETYAGGYLLEPIPGLYKDVIDLDFTSLYPSIIKSLNLGIETLVGRIYTRNNYEQELTLEHLKQKDPNEFIKVERLNKQEYTLETSDITIGKLISLIEKNKYTISASGAIFRTDKRSASSTVLEYWFNKREYYRDLKKKAGKAKEWDKFKLYDLYQHAFKILQNGHYGTYAKNMFRYTDGFQICSAAITNTGQVLTKQSIEFVNNKLNTEHKTEYQYVKISDTDSLYIELHNIIKNNYPDITKEEKTKVILELANEIQLSANKNLNGLCEKLFHMDPKTHYFQLKQEVIASSLLTTGKRRYGMWVTNKEGIDVDELDLKGLEVMKSNMNKMFKIFGEEFIKKVILDTPRPEIDKFIINFYKQVKKTEPKLIGKPMGVSFINKCIKTKPNAGMIFSELNINTKENSRSAIYYNDLLKFKKLDTKYESIIEGDKIFIFNLIKNPYQINVIGMPNNEIPKEIEEFIKVHIDYDKIFESSILNKLKELYSDLGWSFPSLNPYTSKFFSF